MTNSNHFFVHVVGPYDNTFIGPFVSLTAADQYVKDVHNGPSGHIFSAYSLTEGQYRENIETYGAAELQAPEGSLQ